MDQRKRLKSAECHCINLRRAANAVTDYYDWMLADAGITVKQYSLLSNIRKIGPCSVAELSRCVRLERTTLVRNLKALYAAGWIRNDAAPGNRRSKTILTEAGKELLERAKVLWAQAQRDMENYLGAEDLQKLTELLSELEQLNSRHKAE